MLIKNLCLLQTAGETTSLASVWSSKMHHLIIIMIIMMEMMMTMVMVVVMMRISDNLFSCRVHNRQFHWSRLPTALSAIMLIIVMMFVMMFMLMFMVMFMTMFMMMFMLMFMMMFMVVGKMRQENLVHQSVSSFALKSSLS